MDLKKGISYQWRLFVPVLLCFWIIMVSMAVWQIFRVRDFVERATGDEDFRTDDVELPHDELGEISHKNREESPLSKPR